jgi:thiamine-monophosphate kinase
MNPDPGPGENEIVRVIRALAGRPAARGIQRGIGDDAAVVEPTPGRVLVATTDLLLEDVHFRRRWAEPADIGWKALAVNVSDVAAMGGTPRWALVALACAAGTRADEIEAFYEGALALCDAHGVAIVGGDTSASPGGWLVNVTLLGEAVAPVLRSTARPGDVVAVTGTLGRAAAGLAVLEREAAPAGVPAALLADVTAAQLRPRPRVAEAQWLAAAGGVTAMMDVSDGLATDLPRLVAESVCGAVVHVDRLPVAPSTAAVAAALGHDARGLATGGGEDYELLLTCERAAFERLDAGLRAATGVGLTAIGEITATPDVRWLDAAGRDIAIAAGFEHFSRA